MRHSQSSEHSHATKPRPLALWLIAIFMIATILSCAGADSASRGFKTGPNPRLAEQGLDGEVTLYKRSHAVLIGIDAYARWPTLGGAVRDARAMAQVLAAHNTEVTLILNEEATQERLTRLLRDELPERVGPEDRVVIFFAGHGATQGQPSAPKGYLVPVETAASEEGVATSGISMESLQTWMARYPSKHVMFVADACYSGLAIASRSAGPSRDVPDYMKKVVESPVRLSLVAGAQDEQAIEWKDHGLFTWFLIEALRGAADVNDDGLITSDEIVAYVKPNVARVAYEERRHAQNPQMARQGEGEMVFLNPRWSRDRMCPVGTFRDEGGRCSSWKTAACPPNHRLEGEVCVRTLNKVCVGHGFFDPERGCVPSPLFASRLMLKEDKALRDRLGVSQASEGPSFDFEQDTISGDFLKGAYQGVIGVFVVPGESAAAAHGDEALEALTRKVAAMPESAPERIQALYGLAMLTWDRSQRYHEQGATQCGADALCQSKALARHQALLDETLKLFAALKQAERASGAQVTAFAYHHALALLEDGQLLAARERLAEMKGSDGLDAADVAHTRGEVAFLSGDMRQALMLYTSALQDPEIKTPRYTAYKQGMTLLNLGEAAAARQVLNEVEAVTRDVKGEEDFHDNILNELVVFFAQESPPDAAWDYFPQRARTRARLASVLKQLGLAYWDLGDLGKARAVFLKLLEQSRDDAQGLELELYLARVAASGDSKAEVLAHIKRAVAHHVALAGQSPPALEETLMAFADQTAKAWSSEAQKTHNATTSALAEEVSTLLKSNFNK